MRQVIGKDDIVKARWYIWGGVLVFLLLIGLGMYVRWLDRKAVGVPPEVVLLLPALKTDVQRAANDMLQPTLFFEDAVMPFHEEPKTFVKTQDISSGPSQRQSGSVRQIADSEEERPRHPDADAVLAALKKNDREALSALQKRLIAGGDRSLAALQDLLGAGSWRAEVFAMDLLRHVGTPASRIAGVGHLLTRSEWRSRGWHRLTRSVGMMLDGNTVDLMVGMLGEAEGDAKQRLMRLLGSARSEDALFRLYMIGEEHPDPAVRQLAINTVFRSRRPGSIELLKDIMLTNESPEVSALAAVGLVEAGWSSGLQFLAETANGAASADAELARWAIEQARRPQSHMALRRIASDSNFKDDVRLAAVRALGNNYQRARITWRYLEQLASDSDAPAVRQAAAEFLEQRREARNPG